MYHKSINFVKMPTVALVTFDFLAAFKILAKRRTSMDINKLAPWNWFRDEEITKPSRAPLRISQGGDFFSPLSMLHEEINRAFENVFQSPIFSGFPSELAPREGLVLKPKVDVASTDKEYTITVEVPGVEEKDIKLELVDDKLTIKGDKKRELKEESKDFYRLERSYGSFMRVLTLPEDASTEKIDACFKNGVLAVTLPRKALARPESKVIDIKKAV
jgi:HSP20 family protein